VLALVVAWGIVALRLTQPIVLLQISANMAGIVFVVSALHLLYVNNVLLPEAVRPPLWRSAALVAIALFYAFFVTLWLGGILGLV
ncbi:MAG: Nramp family divalent metal transporter, partial [Candidatus Binatia bacterium]